jgi:hypothetical protein
LILLILSDNYLITLGFEGYRNTIAVKEAVRGKAWSR